MDAHKRSPVMIMIVLGGLIPISGSLLSAYFIPDFRLNHYPAHGMVESVGAFASFAIAALIIIMRGYDQLRPNYVWVAAGLLGMGFLDLVHAALHAGQAFVWTHSLATFVGGIFFALVWLPRSWSEGLIGRYAPVTVLFATALIVTLTLAEPLLIPTMVQNGEFTLAATLLNMGGGVGFIASAVFFLRPHDGELNEENVVFSTHAFLFAVAGLLFDFSQLWDGAWWLWHILRMVAYLVALKFFMDVFAKMTLSFKNRQVFLEQAVHERTAELEKQKAHLHKLSQVVDQNPNMIFITDTHARIEYANSKFYEITGYVPEEIIGANPRILKSDKTPKSTYASLWRTITSGETWRAELLDRRRDGSNLWVHATISPIKSEDGEITNFACTHEDITRRMEVETQIRQAKKDAENSNRLKSQFLANMSHEIRTPLNGVLGMAQLLKRTDLEDKQARYVDIIGSSAQSLLSIINDILDISKIESGSMTLEPEPFTLKALVEDSYNTVLGVAKDKGLELIIDNQVSYEGQYIGDVVRLRQVLINLLGNALKFTPEGHVKLSIVEDDQGFLRFDIEDTGPGIDKDQQNHIFKRFSQNKKAQQNTIEGSGLGLTICKELIAMMDGRIGVNSTPGEGSTFWIEVPLPKAETLATTAQKAPRDTQETEAEAPEEPHAIKVLLAEDNPTNQELMRLFFEDLSGYAVTIVGNGQEVLEVLDETAFDVVLMDVNMPVMNGEVATQRVRQSTGPMKDIPIVMLTANVMKEQAESYRALGAHDVLAKPIDFDLLLKKIDEYAQYNQAAQ